MGRNEAAFFELYVVQERSHYTTGFVLLCLEILGEKVINYEGIYIPNKCLNLFLIQKGQHFSTFYGV